MSRNNEKPKVKPIRKSKTERSAVVEFARSEYDDKLRYIHKYYLPPDLRRRIFPIDISGICNCFCEDDEICRYIYNGEIPGPLPDCRIHYRDLGLEKLIDGETVRRVVLAKAAYNADDNGGLTPEEEQVAFRLNAWLIEWEKDLLKRCVQVKHEMERQVRSGDSWLNGYDIDVEIEFYVRDDDPYSDANMRHAWNDDIDCDTSFLFKVTRLVNAFNNEEEEDYWGIGDNCDHNDVRGSYDEGIFSVRHCTTFHELFDHMHMPMKHAGRIGSIGSIITVQHHNWVNVDLKSDPVVSELDEPRIREHIILPDLDARGTAKEGM